MCCKPQFNKPMLERQVMMSISCRPTTQVRYFINRGNKSLLLFDFSDFLGSYCVQQFYITSYTDRQSSYSFKNPRKAISLLTGCQQIEILVCGNYEAVFTAPNLQLQIRYCLEHCLVPILVWVNMGPNINFFFFFNILRHIETGTRTAEPQANLPVTAKVEPSV